LVTEKAGKGRRGWGERGGGGGGYSNRKFKIRCQLLKFPPSPLHQQAK
jgi:hypothetical protein